MAVGILIYKKNAIVISGLDIFHCTELSVLMHIKHKINLRLLIDPHSYVIILKEAQHCQLNAIIGYC